MDIGSIPPPIEIISCRNGLLHIPTRRLLPHTPDFFNGVDLPHSYDPSAQEPKMWLSFLASLWGDDAEAIDTLHEIFGYFLTASTDQQKLFQIIGPTRSGKGVIGRTLTALLGPENVANPTFASLSTNFGLAPLIGKQAAIITDARLSGRADQQAIVERLLSISGEDGLTIDRKYLPAWTGRLSVRFFILSNELSEGQTVECDVLYAKWQAWCTGVGRDHPGTAQTFGRDLRAALPGLQVRQPRAGNERKRYYEGVGLKPREGTPPGR